MVTDFASFAFSKFSYKVLVRIGFGEMFLRAARAKRGGRTSLAEGQLFAAQQRYDCVQSGCPVFFRGACIMAESLDVEADREALLRAGEVNQRGADDAIQHGVGLMQEGGVTTETMEHLLLLVVPQWCLLYPVLPLPVSCLQV